MYEIGEKYLFAKGGWGIANPEDGGPPYGTVLTITGTAGASECQVTWEPTVSGSLDTGSASVDVKTFGEKVMSTLYDSIVQYAVAEESNGQAYNKILAGVVEAGVDSKEGMLQHCMVAEDEYMEEFYGDVSDAKKKNGDWKYRTYLPAAYSTAKSVIGNALDHGVPLVVDGEYRGKTALEAAIKASKEAVLDETTAYDHALNACNIVIKEWEYLTSDERATIKSYIDYLENE